MPVYLVKQDAGPDQPASCLDSGKEITDGRGMMLSYQEMLRQLVLVGNIGGLMRRGLLQQAPAESQVQPHRHRTLLRRLQRRLDDAQLQQ